MNVVQVHKERTSMEMTSAKTGVARVGSKALTQAESEVLGAAL